MNLVNVEPRRDEQALWSICKMQTPAIGGRRLLSNQGSLIGGPTEQLPAGLG